MSANLFKTCLIWFLTVGICLGGPTGGDVVQFDNGDRLVGEVTGLRDGVLHVDLPISSEGLEIKAQSAERVTFSKAKSTVSKKHYGLLKLTNGDEIPCELRALGPEKVSISTWYAGDLTVDREAVEMLVFGVAPDRLAFDGLDKPTDWKEGGGWQVLGDGGLASHGVGTISKSLDLPERYLFDLSVAWESPPNLIFRFGGKHQQFARQLSDEYLFFLNEGGLQIRRHAPGRTPSYHLIHETDLDLGDFRDKKLRLVIKVDRTSGNLSLKVGDGAVQHFRDVLPNVPSGKFLHFQSLSNAYLANKITGLSIYEWDKAKRALEIEDLGSRQNDSLVTTKGERFDGKIHSFDEDAGFAKIITNQGQKFSVPSEEIKVLQLKKHPTAKAKGSEAQLRLTTGGNLSIKNLTLTKDLVQAQHPLLGELELQRSVISAIE